MVGERSNTIHMNAVVAQRGQVTIPKSVRERLGIRPGTVLDMHDEGGRLVAEKVAPLDPIGAALGCIRLGKSTDEVVAELRGDA